MSSKRLLVVGGCGALGKTVIQRFVGAGWTVWNVDIMENAEASHNVIHPWNIVHSGAVNYVESELAKADPFHCIVCAAGGFAMGAPGDSASLGSVDNMMSVCLETAFATSHYAARFLHNNGLTVFTGAAAALGPTPMLLAYGATKAATHHIVSSTATELKDRATVVAVLPNTIDTPGNREAMPDADFSSWTPTSAFAEQIEVWHNSGGAKNGGLYEFQTTSGKTKTILRNEQNLII